LIVKKINENKINVKKDLLDQLKLERDQLIEHNIENENIMKDLRQ
jgi:hypothetical protein